LTITLIGIYGVVIVHQMTWLYVEIVTWHDNVRDENLLNNFSLRQYFVK